MRTERSPLASTALTFAGTLILLVGIAAIPLGAYFTRHGSRWGLALGVLTAGISLATARALLHAGYRGEHPDWNSDGRGPDSPTTHGEETLLM